MILLVSEILGRIESIDEYIKMIDSENTIISRTDAENIRDLLEEYRVTLLETKVHI